jgi:DNA-binding transcriptional LysR family regulator
MRIDYLREFIAYSKTLNLSTTAKRLNITQPALSNHMKLLEQEVGSTLFTRNEAMVGKESQLTRAGRSFLWYAENIVTLYDEAIEQTKTLKQQEQNKIVFQLPRSEISAPVLALIREFNVACPEIPVDLCSWVPQDLVELLREGKVDGGYFGCIVYEECCVEGLGVEMYPIGKAMQYCLVSASSQFAEQAEVTVKDLVDMDILVPSNLKHTSSKYASETILRRFGIPKALKEVYCNSIEEYILTPLATTEAILLDSQWIDFSPLRAQSNNKVCRIKPATELEMCVAFKSGVYHPALDQFKDFIKGRNLD